MKHKKQKSVKRQLELESRYYYKCAMILKSFTSSKSERRMYNAIRRLNEIGKEYIDELNKIKASIRSLPKWENLILPA